MQIAVTTIYLYWHFISNMCCFSYYEMFCIFGLHYEGFM